MNLGKVIPTLIPSPTAVIREGVIVLGGLLLAAYFISRFPKLQAFVTSNSLTVKNDAGATLY